MKISKINKSVYALILAFFAYLMVAITSYSKFLQIPVFPGEALTWWSIIEQLSNWLLPIIAFTFIVKTVADRPIKKEIIDEKKLIAPAVFAVFISGFSVGAHAVAQIVTDFIATSEKSYLYKLVFVFDEYIGHLFFVTLTIAMFFIVILELDRGPQKLSKIDKFILKTLALINGLFWGLGGAEGGSIYLLVIPTAIILLVKFLKIFKNSGEKFKNYPFSHYFLISTVTMLIFTIWWVASHGWLAQPSGLGLKLF